ncbi:YitT family protein [Halomonas sp. WWR20]
MEQASGVPHRWHEDILAILLGTLFVSLGITFYSEAVLLTGSTAGLALLLQYLTGLSFGLLFFVINLPFYYLAVKRMGWQFTLKTFAAIALVALFSQLTGAWVTFEHLNPLYAALLGGGLIGIGMLVLFRHRASLGGINILALYLQDRYGLRAGYFQLGVDILILFAACFVVGIEQVLLSVLGALVINMIIAINHKPGRYIGFS